MEHGRRIYKLKIYVGIGVTTMTDMCLQRVIKDPYYILKFE
jgi:hypothetical protein